MYWRLMIKGAVNGPVVSMQDLKMFKTCMSLVLFAILAAESVKPTGEFLNNYAWGWCEKWKYSNHASILIHRKNVFAVNDFVAKNDKVMMMMMMMVMVAVAVPMVMAMMMMTIVNCMGQHIHEI